jgi:hypothetical protein
MNWRISKLLRERVNGFEYIGMLINYKLFFFSKFDSELDNLYLQYKMFRKCGTVQIFGNDDNKSKPDSGGN